MPGDLLSIIAPVFISAGIGFIWQKTGQPYDTGLITSLVTNIGAPCLVFFSLYDADLKIGDFGVMAVAAALAIAAAGLVGGLVLRVWGLSFRTYLPSLMFANSGNMGLPLSLLAFGKAGLAVAVVYFTMAAVLQLTLGVAIASGSMSPGKLVRIPIIYAVLLALLVMGLGLNPPETVINTTRILGGMTIPMMLITLGFSLAKLKIGSLRRSIGLSALRLAVGFAAGWLIAEALGFSGLERGVLILQSAMPVAVFNYLFAQRYGNHPEEIAGMVVLSTAMSFATLPVLLWLVL